LFAVIVDQETSHRLRPLTRLEVAFRCLDDRAFHQDAPGEGECGWIAEAGLSSEQGDERTESRG
jgi:hypothetical protein